MTITRYAIKRDGKYVQKSGYFDLENCSYTDNIDKALIYTEKGLSEVLCYFEIHKVDIVKIEIERQVCSVMPADIMLDLKMAEFMTEYTELAKHNIDDLSDRDYKRFKRLKRQIKDRVIDNSAL